MGSKFQRIIWEMTHLVTGKGNRMIEIAMDGTVKPAAGLYPADVAYHQVHNSGKHPGSFEAHKYIRPRFEWIVAKQYGAGAKINQD